MKARLTLERIGDDTDQALRTFSRIVEGKAQGLPMPWVAEILGDDDRFGLARDFLPYDKDFAEANSIGSRGVRACYVLESGRVYEVFERTSWRGSRRYFCRVTEAGEIEEITRDQAIDLVAQHQVDEIVKQLKKGSRD